VILEKIADGAGKEDSALYAGICRKTLYNWRDAHLCRGPPRVSRDPFLLLERGLRWYKTTMRDGISVLVLTLNSSATIGRAIESVRDFDEIVVVDGGSSDGTREIASSHPGVRLLENPFAGFSEQRNFGLGKVSCRWCLALDSDEAATPELAEELRRIAGADGARPLYYVMRTEYFMGRAMEEGYMHSLYLPRFFRVEGVSYRGRVHESPFVKGVRPDREDERWGKVDPRLRILHDPANDLRREMGKIGTYSILRAEERIAAGESISAPVLLLSPIRTFLKIYAMEWRKGRRGFIRAILVVCHRTLANLLVYGERVDEEEDRG